MAAVADITEFLAPDPVMQRSRGEGRLAVKALDGRTRIARLYQGGAAKIRVPKLAAPGLEAVLINTSGGLTGGDRVSWSLEAGRGTHLTLTTQACEKIYRAGEGQAEVRTMIKVAPGARVNWIPQETILFDQSSLSRKLEVHLAGDAAFLAVEPVIIGRTGMGETVAKAQFHDRWRIHCDGVLVHAEDARLAGDIPALLDQQAVSGGDIAFATLLYVGTGTELVFNKVKSFCDGPAIGASCWDNKLVVRLVARDGFTLRQKMLPVLAAMRNAPLPRIWHN